MSTIRFEGPCPFLTCLETNPHEHEICPDCGAVRYGNLYCATCREHWPEELSEFKAQLEEANAEAA